MNKETYFYLLKWMIIGVGVGFIGSFFSLFLDLIIFNGDGTLPLWVMGIWGVIVLLIGLNFRRVAGYKNE